MSHTTKAGFLVFCEYFETYQKAFGLTSWSVAFRLKSLKFKRGQTSYNATSRVAVVTLATHWDIPATADNLQRTALHECLHLLLAEFNTAAGDRFVSRESLDSLEEAVVVTLQNFIFKRV